MSLYTKTANDVFAPYDSGGTPRSIAPQDAQVWGVELENSVSALVISTNASVVRGTKAELDAVVGSFDNGEIGLVVTDPTESLRGVYKKVSGLWVKQADLPSDVAQVAADNAALAEAGAVTAKSSAENARDLAEDYRDQAAAIVNDIAQEKEVPIVGTVQGLSVLTIPVGMTAIRFNGYAAMGDGGAWPLAIEVTNTGPVEAWQRQSNGGTRRWQLVTDVPTALMFGGKDDGSTNSTAAGVALRDFSVSGASLKLRRKLGSSTYLMSGGIPALNGQYWDVDDGVIIEGALSRPQSPGELLTAANHPRVTRRTKFKATDNNGYDFWMNPEYLRTLGQKEFFIGEGNLHRPRLLQLNPAAVGAAADLNFVSVTDGGDTFSASPADGTTSGSATWNLTASTAWRFGLRKALWAEQLDISFGTPTAAYIRAACVRCADGRYYLVYGAAGAAALNWRMKPYGVAATTGAVAIPGGGSHLSQQPQNALWSIQVINPTTFAILINGVRIKTFKTASPITEFGFGVQGNAANNITLTGWTAKKSKQLSGAGEARLLVLGDSTAADIYGGWPFLMRLMLEGSGGLAVTKLTNRAVGGWSTTNVLNDLNGTDTTFWTAAGVANVNLSDYNCACIMVGTNDIQGAMNHLTVTRANIDAMIDYLQAAGIEVVIALPSMFYSQALGGGTGGASSNYEIGAIYRVQIEQSAALKGATFAETFAGKGHILGNYKGGDPLFYDQRIRDNIHQTDGGYVLDAYNMACGVMAAMCPETTKRIDRTLMPTTAEGGAVAGITTSAVSSFSTDATGYIRAVMAFTFSSQTLSNTLLYTLPPSMRPLQSIVAVGDGGSVSSIARVVISTNGEVRATTAGAVTLLNVVFEFARE